MLNSSIGVILSPSLVILRGVAPKNLFLSLRVNSAKHLPGKQIDEMKEYYVYILANRSRTLYTGVTNDLERRVYEHKHELLPGFTSKYNITRLVYFEAVPDIHAAIAREKQIKGWLRAKKSL